MNRNISNLSRLVSALAAVLLIGVIFLPIWRIELSAPQYPEGLVLKIFSNRLGGDVDIVNGLNHYIGMRTLHETDFVEFQVLPYIIGLFVVFGLAAALIRRKWFFFTWVALFLVFAATAMMDFYRWEYNYGHNLDPTAPIQVPGMSYQPPLIGYKQLLNFGAYSIPDLGGWIFIAVAFALLFLAIKEIRRSHSALRSLVIKSAALWLPLLLFSSCQSGPEPVAPGKDACAYCKMTFSDLRFGGELVTNKGKVLKFDDIHCLLAYVKEGKLERSAIGKIYLMDYAHQGNWIPAENSFLLQSEELHSPMGGNLAAFSSEAERGALQARINAEKVNWNDLYQ